MADEEPQVIVEQQATPPEITDTSILTERDNSSDALLRAMTKAIEEAKARGEQGQDALKALKVVALRLGGQLQQLRTNREAGKESPMIPLGPEGKTYAYNLDLSSIYYPPENGDAAVAASFGDMREPYNALVAQQHKGTLEPVARELVTQESVKGPTDHFVNGAVEGTHVRIVNRHARKSGGIEKRIFPYTFVVESGAADNVLEGFDQAQWNEQISLAADNTTPSQ
jgi:hypothetical protein